MHYWECEEVVTRLKSFACCIRLKPKYCCRVRNECCGRVVPRPRRLREAKRALGTK